MHGDRQPAPRGPKLELIEALRGAAALAVLVYHAGRHVQKATGDGSYAAWTQFGHVGVDLFFVLSGFIILHVHRADLGRASALRPFLVKRAVRVLPMYWIALLVTGALAGLGSQGWPDSALWLQGLTLHPTNREPLLGVSWTLTHEGLFYAAFSLAIWQLRLGLLAMGVWAAAILVQSAGGYAAAAWPSSILHAYNLEFLFGMAAALWVRRRTFVPPMQAMACGALLIGLGALAEHLGLLNGHGLAARLVYGPAAVALVTGAASAGRIAGPRPARWMLTLGSASYAIYLFQFIFIGVMWQLLLVTHGAERLSHPIVFLLLVLGGTGGGLAVWQWVERPLLARLRPRSRRPA
jgi:peptidoglycan/LPS O-acetylase OafA/YrhL